MIARLFPFLRWFPMPARALRADVLAGITVALVLVPQSMAYAQLAGMPPVYGLYAAFLPVMIGALWGSSPQLATGPVAMVSLLTGSTLAALAAPGSGEFVAYAIALSVMVGVLQLLLGAFRLGAVVNFLSHPVVLGFTNAAAIIIALSQLNKVLGIPLPRGGSFLVDVARMLGGIGEVHWLTLAYGCGAFAAMWALRRYAPAWPGVLLAIAATTLLAWATGYEAAGGQVVGTIPEGLPALRIPAFDLATLSLLATTSLVISLVGFMEAISIAKSMATRTRSRLDANQELIGQGLANIVGSLTQCFPTSGSFSRSAVNLQAGATSGLSSVVTGAIVALTLLYLTPLLYHLPLSVLAAVIMLAVVSLVNLGGLVHAWKAHRHDGIAGFATFAATLAFAPNLDFGILVGGGIALVLFLVRTMTPRFVVLGRHADGTLRDADLHQLPVSPHLVAVRFDGELYFANAAHFEDCMLNVAARYPRARQFLVVSEGINQLDASGDEVLRHLAERLRASGASLAFSGLKKQALDVLRATGTLGIIGQQNIFAHQDEALETLAGRILDADFDRGAFPLLPQAGAA
ncbi:MAG: sulfate permease [Betaproteobacteria bacterium]|nr:sulfate permease [Betaproteobacteria bacterium]